MTRKKALAIIAAIVVIAAAVGVVVSRRKEKDAPCGAGFTRLGTRCCPTLEPGPLPSTCAIGSKTTLTLTCPAPLVVSPHGCDTSDDVGRQRVHVAETTLTIGPSDWEAEGRVASRSIKTSAFFIDRFEVTVGHFCEAIEPDAARSRWRFCDKSDAARAAFGIPLRSARTYCARRGGRLPTEDEWLVAAAGGSGRRYPWGDTGAVCRRAAFGLFSGPCAEGADGPDTVGAHPDGATPLGIHDLAGNVAEWVETGACPNRGGTNVSEEGNNPFDELERRAAGTGTLEPPSSCIAIVRGGSWRTSLATELRTWLRREVSSEDVDPTIGFRCAY